jgi:hypothetical protein
MTTSWNTWMVVLEYRMAESWELRTKQSTLKDETCATMSVDQTASISYLHANVLYGLKESKERHKWVTWEWESSALMYKSYKLLKWTYRSILNSGTTKFGQKRGNCTTNPSTMLCFTNKPNNIDIHVLALHFLDDVIPRVARTGVLSGTESGKLNQCFVRNWIREVKPVFCQELNQGR